MIGFKNNKGNTLLKLTNFLILIDGNRQPMRIHCCLINHLNKLEVGPSSKFLIYHEDWGKPPGSILIEWDKPNNEWINHGHQGR